LIDTANIIDWFPLGVQTDAANSGGTGFPHGQHSERRAKRFDRGPPARLKPPNGTPPSCPITADFETEIGRVDLGLYKRGVSLMIDTLFWYSGVAAWVLIVVAGVLLLAAEINDRSVRRGYK
jgi:hypothetical protein